LGKSETDFAPHGIAQDVGLRELEMIEDDENIRDGEGPGIGSSLVRFVTGTMPTGINQDEVVIVPQRLDVSGLVPALQATVKAMEEHKRRSCSFYLVMNTDILMRSIGHTSLLAVSGCSDYIASTGCVS
jgi:hypothetical protein